MQLPTTIHEPSFVNTSKQLTFQKQAFIYNTHFDQAPNTCFLLHGLGDNSKALYNIIPTICSKGFRVVSFDALGCGVNNHFSTQYDDNIDLLSELISIERKGKLVFIGHSMGGLVILQTILRNNIIPLKIITIEPSITKGDKAFFQKVQESPIGIGFDDFSKNNNYTEGYSKKYSHNLLSSNPKAMKSNIKSVFENFDTYYANILESGLEFDYIYGDQSTNTEERKKLENHKQINVLCMKNSKHWVHIDAEQEFINYLNYTL